MPKFLIDPFGGESYGFWEQTMGAEPVEKEEG